jgi:hypothetical protein
VREGRSAATPEQLKELFAVPLKRRRADRGRLINEWIDGALLFERPNQRRFTFGAALFAMQNSV